MGIMTKLDWNYLQEMELGNGKHGRLVFWEVFCSFLLRLLSCLFLLPLCGSCKYPPIELGLDTLSYRYLLDLGGMKCQKKN